ncbi:hypothetical protein CDAR_291931 [Caerostris darwini]|uniref:H15 domain-containing protein n=1 Tax=Caerostris darwini TaxID=1538125 RepID=A0AAV4NTE9_9ARAC|nr:hypothetical protein CDAR_291931 [Caerostris darwini]
MSEENGQKASDIVASALPKLILRIPTMTMTQRMVLKAVQSSTDKKGATLLFITKFIDSKLNTFSSRSMVKLHLRNAVNNGRLNKNFGKYTIKKKNPRKISKPYSLL